MSGFLSQRPPLHFSILTKNHHTSWNLDLHSGGQPCIRLANLHWLHLPIDFVRSMLHAADTPPASLGRDPGSMESAKS